MIEQGNEQDICWEQRPTIFRRCWIYGSALHSIHQLKKAHNTLSRLCGTHTHTHTASWAHCAHFAAQTIRQELREALLEGAASPQVPQACAPAPVSPGCSAEAPAQQQQQRLQQQKEHSRPPAQEDKQQHRQGCLRAAEPQSSSGPAAPTPPPPPSPLQHTDPAAVQLSRAPFGQLLPAALKLAMARQSAASRCVAEAVRLRVQGIDVRFAADSLELGPEASKVGAGCMKQQGDEPQGLAGH